MNYYFTLNYIIPIINALFKPSSRTCNFYVDFSQILVIFCKSLLPTLYCLPVAVAGTDILHRIIDSGTRHLSYCHSKLQEWFGPLGCMKILSMTFSSVFLQQSIKKNHNDIPLNYRLM